MTAGGIEAGKRNHAGARRDTPTTTVTHTMVTAATARPRVYSRSNARTPRGIWLARATMAAAAGSSICSRASAAVSTAKSASTMRPWLAYRFGRATPRRRAHTGNKVRRCSLPFGVPPENCWIFSARARASSIWGKTRRTHDIRMASPTRSAGAPELFATAGPAGMARRGFRYRVPAVHPHFKESP